MKSVQQLRRVIQRSAETAQRQTSLEALAIALSTKDVKRAMAAIMEPDLAGVEAPVLEAVLAGGRKGASKVNKARLA